MTMQWFRRVLPALVLVLVAAAGTAQWAVVHRWGAEPVVCRAEGDFPTPLCPAAKASPQAVALAAAKGGATAAVGAVLVGGFAYSAQRR